MRAALLPWPSHIAAEKGEMIFLLFASFEARSFGHIVSGLYSTKFSSNLPNQRASFILTFIWIRPALIGLTEAPVAYLNS